MKINSLFLGWSAAPGRLSEFQIYRSEKSATPDRLGACRVHRCGSAFWENLAFLCLWLGALATVGYCFATILSLHWPR